jgi:acyl-CoA thioesterase FadM
MDGVPLVLGIRYPLTGLRARRRARIDILDEARLQLRVRARDCDWYGHINNGRYLSLMDLGRIDLVVRCGFYDACREHGWKPVAAGATIRFRRELRWRMRYELVTRCVGWGDGWWFFEQVFERPDGTLAARAYAKIAMLDATGSRVAPERVMEELGLDPTSPEVPEDVRIWQRIAAG